MGTDLEFLYVADPMCSWCWGFAPVISEIDRRYDIPVHVLAGGLRPGQYAEALTPEMKQVLAHHWHQVEEASGQPFNHEFFARDERWRYDTELPAMGLVAMRALDSDAVLPFLARLQRAFYVENLDITTHETYPDLVAEFAVDSAAFMERLESESTRQLAWKDFEQARAYGAMGFPTLLIRENDQLGVVTRGFMSYEMLEPPLTAWLRNRYGEAAEGLVCAIDGGC